MNEYEFEIYLKSPDGKVRGYEIVIVKIKADTEKDAVLKLYRNERFDSIINVK